MKKIETAAHGRLQKLDGYQKSVIYGLHQEDNHTGDLSPYDGAVFWLEQNAMIVKAANQKETCGFSNAVFPYALQPWVVEELEKDKNLLAEFLIAYDRYETEYRNEQEEKRFSRPYYGYLLKRWRMCDRDIQTNGSDP